MIKKHYSIINLNSTSNTEKFIKPLYIVIKENIKNISKEQDVIYIELKEKMSKEDYEYLFKRVKDLINSKDYDYALYTYSPTPPSRLKKRVILWFLMTLIIMILFILF